MNLLAATYKVLYNGKNITADITDHLISLQYTDKVQGETDELELVLEDADGLWQNAWYPEKGSTIEVEIDYNGSTLKCGVFSIDEIEFSVSRSGDTISIKNIAAAITKKLKTKRSTAHENKSLREIANTVAARHSLTVQGNIPNITVARVTQHKKNDLEFLQRLALDFGLTFNIRADKLIFTNIYELESSVAVTTMDKSDFLSLSLKDKTAEVYKAAHVKYQNPEDGELNEGDVEDPEAEGVQDTLEIRQKAENKQQAEIQAKSALHQANSAGVEGSFSTEGNTLLVSGVNTQIQGIGKMSGIFHITQSTHSVDRNGGYSTSFDAKRVAKIDVALNIPKKKPVARRKPASEDPGGLFFEIPVQNS